MNTINKDLLNDFLLDIKAPTQFEDFLELMKINGLTKEADLLSKSAVINGFNANSIIFVENILKYCGDNVYMYDCDGDKDYFTSHKDGTYEFSYTDMVTHQLRHTEYKTQDLYIYDYDNDQHNDELLPYIGIILTF